ncbi:MAG: hypothetical protein ACTHJ3_00710 [Pararhizobium sp.]
MQGAVYTVYFLVTLYVLLILAAIAGWFMNLVAFFTMSWATVTPEFVIRLVGIPVGIIGAIYGWF